MLVIGLVFLLIMTLSGLASVQSTSLDEHMAGNSRDRNLAFQSAEAALREAEDLVQNGVAATLKSKTNPQSPDPLSDAAWTGQQTYSDDVAGVVSRPVYVVNVLDDTWGSSLEFCVAPAGLYQVTAKSLGGTDTAVVVLQTSVGRRECGP